MTKKQDITSINALFDIKAESLAARLLNLASEKGKRFEIDQILIAPQGDAKRRSHFEVGAVKKKEYGNEEVFQLEIHRKGLFDSLPQGLFLRKDDSKKDAKARARETERQIKEARKFFLPFEQAAYLPRIDAERLEQKWTEHFPPFIEKIWGLNQYQGILNNRQKFLLCYLLPEAYRIVGNWKLTGLCFEAVLNKPVDLSFVKPLEYSVPKTEESEREAYLGGEFILGDSFRDDVPALEITVKGITKSELPGYLEGGDNLRILKELLFSYFIPLAVPVVLDFEVTADSWEQSLGESFVGFNTRIENLAKALQMEAVS